jgi:hypothetical protein
VARSEPSYPVSACETSDDHPEFVALHQLQYYYGADFRTERGKSMKVRRLMAMLNEMGSDNDIFVQEVDCEGRIMVETKYTVIEVHQILNWTYINIVKEHEDTGAL